MQVISEISALRQQIRDWRKQGEKIAFVPTMGNLHQGHLSLVEQAHKLADKVVVSIFVNPTQFNDKSDLVDYPRTLEQDLKYLELAANDMVFTPTVETVYPNGMQTQTTINVPKITERLCGAHRAGHFEGVATVVTKLFNMVCPDVAVFGEKDYQQLLLIKKMVSELNMPIEIVGAETHREDTGLAMSSRNQYLSTEQKHQASQLYQELSKIKHKIEQGERRYDDLSQQARQNLEQQGFNVDYIEVCNAHDLELAQPEDKSLRILLAAELGSARLIDNLACNLAG